MGAEVNVLTAGSNFLATKGFEVRVDECLEAVFGRWLFVVDLRPTRACFKAV